MRINDDVVLNTNALIKHFKELDYVRNRIYGFGIRGVPPIRDPNSKFYVSEKEYPHSTYDPYIEGSAYLLTTDLAATFYNKYLDFHYPPFSVWLEYVYIGMLSKMFNTTIIDIRNFFAPGNQFYRMNKEEITDILLSKGVNNTFFVYSSNDFEYFWNIFTNSSLQFVTTSTTTTTTTTTITTTTTTSTTSTVDETTKSFTIDPVYQNDEFLLNPKEEICNPGANKVFLFITMVVIRPDSFEKRAMIRKTWANVTLFGQDMKLIFLLAKSDDEFINKQILDDYKHNKDILLKNYTDSYHNLTAKIMFGLNWVSKYCANSKYILRINDDVIVNTYALISYLKNIEYKPNLIYGYRIAGVGPIRYRGSKFYVSEKDYRKNYYETYIEGSAYLFTTDLAPVYHKKYLNYYFPPFSIWLEDVYIG